jgi:hypothetical protein
LVPEKTMNCISEKNKKDGFSLWMLRRIRVSLLRDPDTSGETSGLGGEHHQKSVRGELNPFDFVLGGGWGREVVARRGVREHGRKWRILRGNVARIRRSDSELDTPEK